MARRYEFYVTAGIATDMDSDISFASEIGSIIHQFINDDWGTLCKEDCESNEQAKKDGGRILGAYETTRGRVYVITDDALANPKITTVLYASKY